MTPVEKLELRELVREHLADRPRLALAAEDLHRPLSRKIHCTIPEIEDALALLVSLQQVETVIPKLGSVKFYQITAAGTLAHERGE